MGKRSQSLTSWPKRHNTPFNRQGRVWICADCKARGCQLIACTDGRQRCPTCKREFDRQGEAIPVAVRHTPSPILPAGQLVQPPRVSLRRPHGVD